MYHESKGISLHDPCGKHIKNLAKKYVTILENLLKRRPNLKNLDLFPYGNLKLYFFREALSNSARVERGTSKHSAFSEMDRRGLVMVTSVLGGRNCLLEIEG